jgi:hypothetical protein
MIANHNQQEEQDSGSFASLASADRLISAATYDSSEESEGVNVDADAVAGWNHLSPEQDAQHLGPFVHRPLFFSSGGFLPPSSRTCTPSYHICFYASVSFGVSVCVEGGRMLLMLQHIFTALLSSQGAA